MSYRSHLPGVGTYRVRLLHRHGKDDFADSLGDIDGWICSRSEEFTIRVRPHEIRLEKGERKKLRERFDAIDFKKPPICVHLSRNPTDEFVTTASAPEDEIYRAGWTAVPTLLDVIDDPNAKTPVLMWAFSLLFDITGLHGPEPGWSSTDPWGPHRSRLAWPTIKPPANWMNADEGQEDRVVGAASVDAALITDLRRRWTETRKSLAIHE
jgi:hypothetical protein